jgi:DNA uptake protein ComE-like DNA-binding protein
MIAMALIGFGACADRGQGAADSADDASLMDEVQDGMNRVAEGLDDGMADDGIAEDQRAVAGDEAAGELLDVNLASAEELGVVGLSAAAVAAITAGRPFENMVQVDEVLVGVLDEEAREEAYRSIWIPLDLNAASREEILLIPGVGSRMAHEFEEYRPYTAMAQFRREIGKYVDDAEVERLASYVRVE